MERPLNRRNQYWIAGLTAVVVVVGAAVVLSQQRQERLQTAALQEQSKRDALLQEQSALALRNELQSSAQREASLQQRLRDMDAENSRQKADTASTEAGATMRQATTARQEAVRKQAEQELQDLRAQRSRLEKQVNCERIQLTMNQLSSTGANDQASRLLTLWNGPCPRLQIPG